MQLCETKRPSTASYCVVNEFDSTAVATEESVSSASEAETPGPLPKYPKYELYRVRYDSFRECPEIAADRKQLCEAGFFYAGMGDCTRCFHCGVGKQGFHFVPEVVVWTPETFRTSQFDFKNI